MNPAALALSAVLALVPGSCGAQPAPTAHAAVEGAEIGVVTKVVDGDTFDVAGVGRIRLAGPDSCEMSTSGGRRAKADAVALLAGKAVTLTPARRDEDRYGRKLRLVRLPDGRDYGLVMIARNHTGLYRDGGDAPKGYVAQLRAADTDGRDCG